MDNNNRSKFDVWISRISLIALGLMALSALVGAIALTIVGLSVPDGVIGFGSAAAGALIGLLVPSPLSR